MRTRHVIAAAALSFSLSGLPAAPAAAQTQPSAPAAQSTACDQTVRTRVRAWITRDTQTTIRITGLVDYWTSAGWKQAPTGDYTLQVVFWRDGAWRSYRRIPGGTLRINATGASTYRFQYFGDCEQGTKYAGSSPRVVPSYPAPARYASCAALRRVYPWGVSAKAAPPAAWYGKGYALNTHLDRDKDKVACET